MNNIEIAKTGYTETTKASTQVLAFVDQVLLRPNPTPYSRISATTAAKACAGSAAWLIGRPITK